MRRVARGAAPAAAAGCETVHWGAFGGDRRKISDGPQQQDGTWQRTRTIWTPASYYSQPCYQHNDILDEPNTPVSCEGPYCSESIGNQDSNPR